MSKPKKPTLDLSLSASSSSSSDDSDLEDVDVEKGDGNVDKKTEKKKSKKKDLEDELAGSDFEEMLRSPSTTTTDDDEVEPISSKKGKKKKAGPKKKRRKSSRFGGGDEDEDDDDDDDDSDDDADEEIDIANIGARLGFLLDAEDLHEMEEEEERVPVDPIIEELLNKGLGKGKAKMKKEKKLREQITRLSAHTALEITAEGRLNLLVEDVETVRKTKEKVDVLIKALEATRDKLIKEVDSFEYTEPPFKTKPPPPKSRFGQGGSSGTNS
ncbi:unnamed protein product [Orchesella dallaii]|uniref:Uncharacterized protein n=1 Tax=Orchesella dallaii TaxID=48710 RepID=A0ABP1RYL3_9HEXA